MVQYPTSMATKSSVFVFFLSLTRLKSLIYGANITTVFVVNTVGLSLTFLLLFRCSPINAAFHFKTQSAKHCADPFKGALAEFGILQAVANLFIAMCGPRRYSETRLCIAKGLGDTGIPLAHFMNARLFDRSNASFLASLQWPRDSLLPF
jgi:hypothetical protein